MRKAFKITLYIFCSLVMLLVCLVLALNTPWGQNFVCGKAVNYLRGKLKTEVQIGHLGVAFPKYIVLERILFLDQSKDTLLAAGKLKIDLDMMALLHKQVNVQQVMLSGIHSHIYRNHPDTTFNFSYIVAAFTSNKPKENKPKDTTSTPLKLTLDRVSLDDIHFRMEDHTGGMQFAVNLDHLDLRMKELDMQKMLFHVKQLDIAGLQTEIAQDTSYLPPNPHPTKTQLSLAIDNSSLDKITLNYNDRLNQFLFGLNLGSLQLQLNKFGLGDNVIDVKQLVTKNTDINLQMGSATRPPAFVDTLIKIDTTVGWSINAGNVELANVSYKMDNNSKPHQPVGLDYMHMFVHHTNMKLNRFHYTGDTISGSIKQFSGTEQCGLDIRSLKTDFNYNPQGATLSSLYFQTPESVIQDHLEVHYPSIEKIAKQTGLLGLNLHIFNSKVSLHDVLMFVPQLHDQEVFRKYKYGPLKLEASVTGRLNNLNIAHLYLAGMSNTDVLLNGKVSGLPETKDLHYDLNITRLKSSAKDVAAFVPDTLLSSVRIPDNFGITGHLAGNMKDYSTNIYFVSSDGIASVNGGFFTSPGKGRERYDMTVHTQALNLGRILKKDSLLGMITADITAKGKSLDVKNMEAQATGTVTSAMVKGYRYHNIQLTASVAAQKGKLDLVANDPNLQVQLAGNADFSGKYVAAKADIQIDSIDLQALKLYSSELRAMGKIHADFPVLNPDYPKGTFVWWAPVVLANGKRYYMDSIYVKSNGDSVNGQDIFADLNVATATVKGKIPLTKAADIIQEHINRHTMLVTTDTAKKNTVIAANDNEKKRKDFRIKLNKPVAITKDTAAKSLPGDYNMTLTARVVDKPLLHSLLPGLTKFDSVHLDASLTPQALNVNAVVPGLVYNSITLKNVKARVNETDSSLTYNVTTDQISQGAYALYFADVHGGYDANRITTNISLSDVDHKERFALVGDMTMKGDSQVIQLHPGLKLNYATWDVAEPNGIVLSDKGFFVRNLGISSKDQFIKANSPAQQPNTPLKVDISNFRLSNITDIISKGDTVLASGILSGNIVLEQTSPDMKLVGDLQITKFAVLGDTLGDLQCQLNNRTANTVDTKVTLKGNGNDIAISGFYYVTPVNGNAISFDADINALALKSFEGLAMNQVKNSSGYVRGKLKVEGTFSDPKITGDLRTDNLVTTVSALNAEFKMPAEKIEFTPGNVKFNDFKILDNAGNKAALSGTVGLEYLTDPSLDLKIDATNWHALHSTAKDNKEYYGDLFLTTRMKISGYATSPSVDGNLNILKGTKLTVVNPQQNPELQSTKGIVAFINMKDTTRGTRLVARPDSAKVKHKLAAGSDINVNISIDKTAEFSLVIDEATGDFISVSGDAYINTSVTPGGEFTLTGTYLLHKGAYQMNYNFIKRKFQIQDGSSMTFAGDPLKGTTLDITASYAANVPPYDLVSRQVSDQAQLNYFKQNLPFAVNLHLNGKVLEPVITFDIDLPENKVYPLTPDQIQLVESKLSQLRTDSSELNKQVFAVLILNRFVSDDPFSNGAGSSLSSTAMQSVSTFIGEQLNQAAGKLVKGVDVSVDLATTDDYTSGNLRQRTDLNLAASKRLLNDRLKLTVGNDFELEGPQTSNDQQSALVPSNLSADYLLTADGRYTMQVYRRNYDAGVLEGYVTQSGVNFIVSVDYNRFKTIFQKRKPKNTDAKPAGK